ncbi:hypothetical protein MMC32_004316 [Xylographa parallela]|nr:hypothetical protein [Xylographa parallela]
MSSAFQPDLRSHLPFSTKSSSSTEKPMSRSISSESYPRDLFAIGKPRDRSTLLPRKSNFNNRLNAPLLLHAASSAVRSIRPSVSEDNYHRALNILPPEIIDRVAFFLPRDRDICNLDSTCLQTHVAISHPRSGIWIQRFSETFDIPASIWGVGVNFQSEYKCRQWTRKLLKKRQIHVVGGLDALNNNEGVVIEFVRELIDDSFAVASSYGCSLAGKRISKNLKHLKEVTVNSFFLDNSMRFASNEELSFPQLQLYRLILTHLALDESARVPHCFEYSQKAVYGKSMTLGITCMLLISRISSRPPPRFPTVNFFKYHITNPDEHSLHAPFHALPDDERPTAWDSPVKAGLQKLAYLHNGTKLTPHLRGHNPGYIPTQVVASAQNHINLTRPHSSHIYSDVLDIEENDDGFLSMHLDFSRPKAAWPPTFERHLASERSASARDHDDTAQEASGGLRARDRYHQFQGFGHHAEPYRCVGYVGALPAQDPQHVHPVHGFQRLTMMQWADDTGPDAQTPGPAPTAVETHLADVQLGDLAHAAVEHWAYEGVVLPGGKIILGRWWCPSETPLEDLGEWRETRVHDRNERKCTGPFIFWNVDGAESTLLCEGCAP